MQPTKTSPVQQQPSQKSPGSTGPTPIDPRDFKYVAGGLPKSGWGTAAIRDTQA